jgi:hypothetical protein
MGVFCSKISAEFLFENFGLENTISLSVMIVAEKNSGFEDIHYLFTLFLSE